MIVSKVIIIALSIHVREWTAMALTIVAIRSHVADRLKIAEATVAAIQQALKDKSLTCHRLVQAYLDRIAADDHNGPARAAILAQNPNALAKADRDDTVNVRSGPVGPLHWVLVVLQDNCGTADQP